MRITRSFYETRFGTHHIREAGSGATVVLLHQTADSSREFLKIIPALSRSYRVIAIDTLGYGDSSPSTTELDVKGYSHSKIALLNSMGIEDFFILGNHTGATLAVDLAYRMERRVRGVIANGLALWDKEEKDRLWKLLYKPIEIAEDGSHLIKFWEKAKYSSELPKEIIHRGCVDCLKADDFLAAYRAIFDYDLKPALTKLECPLLVVTGEHDPMTRYSDEVAKLTNFGSSCTVKNAKFHLADLHTDKYLKIIFDFLSKSANKSYD